MSELVLRNRQRARRVNTPLLRRITRTLLDEFIGSKEYELCIHLVAAPEMAHVNKQFLQHEGSTDVITFDDAHSFSNPPTPDPSQEGSNATRESHSSPPGRGQGWVLHGEIFICMDDAISQARQFRTTWQTEIVRYIVHGVLHLLGYDDIKATARRKMKSEENRLLRRIVNQFPIARLAR